MTNEHSFLLFSSLSPIFKYSFSKLNRIKNNYKSIKYSLSVQNISNIKDKKLTENHCLKIKSTLKDSYILCNKLLNKLIYYKFSKFKHILYSYGYTV
ncbi:hypothetical protein FG386_003460 [Cryptosporidium ryanae]|uniref:uncharacterized protein n=1 Tax=Cryptosporidium ryanae TaxID=515981 RepID=UPI00351A6B3A|nr:hypothetical protein FG386_003460 [Cryptosporidium ryanae]